MTTNKFELIDQAYNIIGFDNQATELTYALNKLLNNRENNAKKLAEEETAILNGFKLVLELIEQYPELIRPTLYGTMKLVKRKYHHLTKFTRNHTELHAVSLALNHLVTVSKFKKIVEQVEFAYV